MHPQDSHDLLDIMPERPCALYYSCEVHNICSQESSWLVQDIQECAIKSGALTPFREFSGEGDPELSRGHFSAATQH